MEIRDTFLNYLLGLGFTKTQILKAWKKSQTTIYKDTFTLELMTRDLLQRPKETKESMKEFIKK